MSSAASFGQRIRTTRHNRDAAASALDDRVDAFTYDSGGNLTAEIVNYVNGQVNSPGDDITPNVTTLARTDLTTIHTYDTAGNRVSSADPRRAMRTATGPAPAVDDYITRWTYDALSQRLTEKTPTTPGLASTQRTASTSYDQLGLERTVTDFGALVTATEYDRVGRALRTFEDPDPPGGASETARRTYDADGKLLTSKDRRQVADASLGQTTYAYDSIGRQTLLTEADGTATEAEMSMAYDALDQRTSLEVGAGSAASLLTTRAHDLGGRAVETDDGFTCATTTYDYRGLETSTRTGLEGGTCGVGPDERTLSHSYDAIGRLTRTEITAGLGVGDRPVDDLHDAVGNLRSTSVRTGGTTSSTTFGTNRLDQITSEVPADASTAKTNFDAAGNATDRCFWAVGVAVGVCHPVGTSPWTNPPTQVTTASYDARNQRISLADAAAGSTTTYDPLHNYQIKAVYRTTANGREHQSLYSYDARHRLTVIAFQTCAANSAHTCSGTPVNTGSDTYTYDDADNRTRVLEANGATSSDRRYCYDARGQLTYRNTGTACSSTAKDESWNYDDAGNRLTATSGGQTTNFAYHSDGRLCDVEVATTATCVGGNVSHDSAGRIEAWNAWTFAYDAEGRITSACKSPTCASGSDHVGFTYDADGHRTTITATAASGTVTSTEFRYQGDAVAEERVNGTAVRRFVTDEAGSITKLIVPAGQPNAGTYLVTWNGHGDALNLLRVNADGTTTLANAFTYDTWGRPTTTTHNGVGDLGFRYLYVGQFDVQWDDTFGLGLHYMHARHYSPLLGRFLQPDPAALDVNLYAYVGNNPITRSDAAGTCWWCQIVQRAWQWLGSSGWPTVQRWLGSAWQWVQQTGAWHWTAARWNELTRGLSIAWNAGYYSRNISSNAWNHILQQRHGWAAHGVSRQHIQNLASEAITSTAMQIQRGGGWRIQLDWIWINWGFRAVCVQVYVYSSGYVSVTSAWIGRC